MLLTDITIIVPTRNETHNLPLFLRSLPTDLPLIVVDASNDDTPGVALALRPNHTQVIRHPGNVSWARQMGAEAATTAWLLFTDADVNFDPSYFTRLAAYPARDALYGTKLSRTDFAAYYRQVALGQQWAHWLGLPAVSGSNLLVRREVLQGVGGFDVTLPCTEDSELGWRLKRRGYRIDFAPELMVWAHDHRRLKRGINRKTLHTLTRSVLLYFNLLPQRWRQHDWGYWSS